jgi:enoyl-CoA hydratase
MSQTYETLVLEKRERVAIITINRPEKRNALNIKTREEGAALLEELRSDSSVGVVVFTGAGDKAFIAGADIAEFAGRTSMMQRDVMMMRSLFTAIDTFPKPVIAMINGYCLGGGCELALACDIRIASETASFGQPEINLGIIPGGGGTQRLTRLVGEGKAMEMILTGEIIDAKEAERIGLVVRVFPHNKMMGEVLKIADRIAAAPFLSVRHAKALVRRYWDFNKSAEGAQAELDAVMEITRTADCREGIRAFLDKRPPNYRGPGYHATGSGSRKHK